MRRLTDSEKRSVDHAREILHREHAYDDESVAMRVGGLEYHVAALLDILDPAGAERDRLLAEAHKSTLSSAAS